MRTLSRALAAALTLTLLIACGREQPSGDAATLAAESEGAVETDTTLLSRADAGRIRGDTSARVWMVIISDFQCPFCRRWHEESYAALTREFVDAGQLRMAFLQFPLPSHRHAVPAAEATMCASAQGRFWELQDSILLAQERWSSLGDARPAFEALATSIGLDMAAWRNCMATRATMPLIEVDLERARQMGVRSTPSFIVGDRAIAGALPLDTFRVAIREAVARSRTGSSPPAPR